MATKRKKATRPARKPARPKRAPRQQPESLRLRSIAASFTVNDAAMERSRSDSGCWRGARLGRAGFRAGRAAFFFVAIVDSSLGVIRELVAPPQA